MIPMHRSSADMARSLASYMKDARAIQKAVYEQFHHRPSLHTIRYWMDMHRRQKARAREERYLPASQYAGGVTEGPAFRDMLTRGSEALRKAICREHPAIMAAYEAQGLSVVRS